MNDNKNIIRNCVQCEWYDKEDRHFRIQSSNRCKNIGSPP